MTRKGFTLIELLIVVLIIAILAAIAVPNFLEFQTRAKVSRVKADMRTVVTAIEALHVDYGVMLVDYWDDDDAQTVTNRLHGIFGRTDQGYQDRGGPTGILVPLTTPIAYISSVPTDPFTVNQPDYGSLIANDQLPPWTFLYLDDDPMIEGDDAADVFLTLAKNQYLLISPGPNNTFNRGIGETELNNIVYDPTNGTISEGNIIYDNFGQFNARSRE